MKSVTMYPLKYGVSVCILLLTANFFIQGSRGDDPPRDPCPDGFQFDSSMNLCQHRVVLPSEVSCPEGYLATPTGSPSACVRTVKPMASCKDGYAPQCDTVDNCSCMHKDIQPLKAGCPDNSKLVEDTKGRGGFRCEMRLKHKALSLCNHGFVLDENLGKCIAVQTVDATCVCPADYQIYRGMCILVDKKKCSGSVSNSMRGSSSDTVAVVGLIEHKKNHSTEEFCPNRISDLSCECPVGTYPIKSQNRSFSEADIASIGSALIQGGAVDRKVDTKNNKAMPRIAGKGRCIRIDYRDLLPKCEDEPMAGGEVKKTIDSDLNPTPVNDCYNELNIDLEYTCDHLNTLDKKYTISCVRHDPVNTRAASTSNANIRDVDGTSVNERTVINPKQCVCKYIDSYKTTGSCPEGFTGSTVCTQVAKPVNHCRQGNLEVSPTTGHYQCLHTTSIPADSSPKPSSDILPFSGLLSGGPPVGTSVLLE